MGKKTRFYDRELDEKAVERIIVATGLNCALADREELSIDLPMCRALCVSAKYSFSPTIAKRRAAKLRQLSKLTAKLLRLLEEDEISGDILREIDLRKGDPRASLKSLIMATQYLLPRVSAPIGEKFEHMGLSEFENLAGIALPNVFKTRFHRPARISRNKEQDADGPFIRFAHQALVELDFKNNGKPYSRESIARALTLARGGRNRRK